MDNSPYKLRPHVKEDFNLIYSTWLRELYEGNDWFRMVDRTVFFEKYRDVIDKILFHPDVKINVVCLKDDKDVVLGYCVSRPGVLDWVYTKKAWRRLGIAKMLVTKNVHAVTHLTDLGLFLKPRDWSFNPFL